MLCFASSFLNMLGNIPSNNIRSAPASSALTLVSHQKHNMVTANRHLYGSGERNGAQTKTKVNFGRTRIQALELLRLSVRSFS